jgi:hypothetical protein
MDTEQLTEEQLYYKEKYFKYKLKYLTLKEHLGGNKQTKATGNKVAPAAAKKQATVKSDDKKVTVKELGGTDSIEKEDNLMETNEGKKKFRKDIAELITKYFEAKYNSDELYTKLKNKNIFIKIHNQSQRTISISIDVALRSLFPNDNDDEKTKLKKYLWDIIKKFYKIKEKFEMFNSKEANKRLLNQFNNSTIFLKIAQSKNDEIKKKEHQNNIDLYNILIKKQFIDKFEEEVKKNIYVVHEKIDTVIDVVLQKITDNDDTRQKLKSLLINDFFIYL